MPDSRKTNEYANVLIETDLDFLASNKYQKRFKIKDNEFLASAIRLARHNDLCIFPVIDGDVFYSTILYRVHPDEISKDVLEYHIQRFCEQQKH